MSGGILRFPWTSQPQTPAPINAQHPMGTSWALVHVPGVMLFGDANPAGTFLANTSIGVGRSGRSLKQTGSAANSGLNFGANSKLLLNTSSGIAVCTCVDAAGYSPIFDTAFGPLNGAFGLYVDIGLGKIRLLKKDTALILESSNAVAQGGEVRLAWSYNASTGRARIALNGVLTSGTSAQTLTHNQFNQGGYWSDHAAGTTPSEQALLAVSPVEQLSDAALIWASLNPWQLFAPLSRTIWVAAAGGGGISATASITLADVTSSATGTLPIAAALAKTLDAVTTSATSTLSIAGAAAITLGALTSSAAGTLPIAGTLSKTLDDVTTSATGTLPITAASAVTLDALTTSATGTLPLAAAASVTLADVTTSATGTLALTGAATQTLDDVTTVATGTQGGNSGTASITLDAMTTSATGVLPLSAAAGITLDAATVASASTLVLKGAQSTTLEDVTLTATGAVGSFVYGQADITLGNVTLTSAGTLPIAGSASVSLDALSLSAASTLLIKGSSSITLANLTIVATSGDTVERLFTNDIHVQTIPTSVFATTRPTEHFVTSRSSEVFLH